MLNDFREWLSDNLRYILLGLGVILVIVIVFFAVKLVKNISSNDSSNNAKQTESGSNESESDPDSTDETKSEESDETNEEASAKTLQKDAYTNVNEFIEKYFKARQDGDMDTLSEIVDSFSDSDESTVNSEMQYIESFQDIECYTLDGINEGEYIVYVVYNVKYYNIETVCPSMSYLYVVTKDDASLYIHNFNNDDEVTAYIEEANKNENVQTLKENITTKYEEAKAADEKLSELFGNITSQSDSSDDTTTTANKVVTALKQCNVRADSNMEAEILGVLEVGDEITRVRVLDNEWTEVKYGTVTAYVYSEYLSD